MTKTQTNEPINHVKLIITHYPLEIDRERIDAYGDPHVIHSFYFEPRVFKANKWFMKSITEEGLRIVRNFVYEKLATAEIHRYVKFYVSFTSTTPPAFKEIIGETIEVHSEFKITKYIRTFVELKELYNKLYATIKMLYNADPQIIAVFENPVVILIPKEEIKELYEKLLQTDSQLNVESAYRLFGADFAKRVQEHNKMIREKRKKH